ncbi:MAG: prepilin-type N-terminal cleavage/methylation domain-containing protein [Planctomycetota bacterium]|nr:prepilin-type N-terminal cleavage/methylation domain-containing protein [Planctomycetota bacterium]
MRLCSLGALRPAFTFVEVMIVVVIVGILAAIAIPQFGGVTDEARSASLQGSLGGVRSGLAGYRSRQVLAGNDPFPTLVQLTTAGTVMQSEMPTNPFNGLATVQAVSLAQAQARTVVNPTTYGWNYYVDNAATPPAAIFYANSSEQTTVTNGAGGFKAANQL